MVSPMYSAEQVLTFSLLFQFLALFPLFGFLILRAYGEIRERADGERDEPAI